MWRRRIPILLILALLATPAPAHAIGSRALLDSLQRTAFQYFWMEANPANGLIRDRNQSWSPASIASVGFGLSAICVGVDHGWVTRTAARDRVVKALKTFNNGSQAGTTGAMGYKGFFYHFLDMNAGTRVWDSELSTIDTALLLAGILDAAAYFSSPTDTVEARIRWYADAIYNRIDWDWARNGSPGIRMGWQPPGAPSPGFLSQEWVGYNEGMIIYILALGSPTHPPANMISAWDRWTSGYWWSTHYGYTYVNFPPLFGHQYSHCWIDFRGIQDAYMQAKGITYFENSRRATYAQRAYCIANPLGRAGYSAVEWGLTAGDGPNFTYAARGAPPSMNDDGTITPTAPISSLPFAPGIVLPTIQHLWDTYHDIIWGPYGFTDGYNLGQLWWDQDVIGIDQGPIILMIENYLTGNPWSRFMANPSVQLGLTRAGFLPSSVAVEPEVPGDALALAAAPNPYRDRTSVTFSLARAGAVKLAAYDLQGREVARLASGEWPSGVHTVEWNDPALGAGVYFLQLEHEGGRQIRRCVRLR